MSLPVHLTKDTGRDKPCPYSYSGQTIVGIVTQIIGLDAIEVRNRTFSKVIIRLDVVDAMVIS